jgi:hypothetical protein
MWTVDAIFPLPLRSAEGARSFFRIKEDPVVQQPTLLGTTSYFLGQGIVPLVAQVPGEPILRCSGTGFFIRCSVNGLSRLTINRRAKLTRACRVIS